MYKFAHISDLHLAPLPQVRWTQLLNKRVIGYINWRLNRQGKMQTGAFRAVIKHMQQQPWQHLMISGDLVNLALPQEFEQARNVVSSFGEPNDVSLVFGNHDAYVPGAYRMACRTFRPWIASDKIAAVSDNQQKQCKTHAFPYLRIREKIAFIGVSSALATPPFFASGYFGAKQAAHLADILKETAQKGLFRVIMIHHPPFHNATAWYKTLWGIDRFQAIIRKYGAELILHGHTHLPTLSYINGKGNKKSDGISLMTPKVPVVGVPSTAQEYGGHKPAAGYNLFEVTQKSDGSWNCLLERYALLDKNNRVGRIQTLEL